MVIDFVLIGFQLDYADLAGEEEPVKVAWVQIAACSQYASSSLVLHQNPHVLTLLRGWRVAERCARNYRLACPCSWAP
eukprot:1510427-Rhodomonas_salina.2